QRVGGQDLPGCERASRRREEAAGHGQETDHELVSPVDRDRRGPPAHYKLSHKLPTGNAASERCERATRSEGAGGAARERACRESEGRSPSVKTRSRPRSTRSARTL